MNHSDTGSEALVNRETPPEIAEVEPFPGFKLPGDEGWHEHMFETRRRMAATLSERGWKFIKRQGPRGIYYDGIGPQGERIMSTQKPDESDAIFAALDHAIGVMK